MISRAAPVRRWVQTTRRGARTAAQLSYVKGAKTPPLLNETLASFYEKELLARFATRPALVSRHEPIGNSGYLRLSYEELWKEANNLARGLLGLGVTKGTRVGVVMANNRYDARGPGVPSLTYAELVRDSAYAQLQWACSIIGAILVTINPAYKVHELVSPLLANRVSYPNPNAVDENVKPRRGFTFISCPKYPNV